MAAPRIPERPSLWVDLLGATVRVVADTRYKTRVIEAGSGDPLILIHGVGSSAELFARNVMRLANDFHVYAIDALYHGYSSLEPYDSEHRVERQAEAVLDFMDALGIAWAHIEGESMGAGMAFHIGLNHPERCGKLVLNSGSYYVNFKREFPDTPEGNLLVPLCRDSVTNFSRETVRRRMEYLVASPDHLTEELVDVQYRMYAVPEIRESMARVYGISAPRPRLMHYEEEVAATLKPPVLVLWTDRNRGAGPEVGEYLASVIPGAQFQLIENAAHWPQWEQPEQHDGVVAAFLKSSA
ncbi:MAG: alpha/beta hydrolase [Chloroflexi bacterium]|nr:alpha/beta hydrolase [Chloroflexota bacterium]MYK35470.1 alpha/beta hydrolase [Chloroflexota bacterium]